MAKKKAVIIISVAVILIVATLIFFLPNKSVIEEQPDNMYMISHSEYWGGEEGQIITRLINYRSEPIVDANCTMDIMFPNKTYFKFNKTATFNVDSYYYVFTTPEIEGVYEYRATCTYDSGTKSRSVMNSFHLSPALQFIETAYTNLSKLIENKSQFEALNITMNLILDYLTNIVNPALNNIQDNMSDVLNNLTTVNNNVNNLPDNIWDYNNRTLTELDIIVNVNQSVIAQDVWNYSGRYIHGELP